MPKLIILNPDGTTVKYGLNGRNFTVGRAENNDVVLPGGSSSNHHAVLKQTDSGDFSITDLDSTNHTRVNNVVVQSSILRNGDSVMFGDIRGTYESEFAPAPLDDQATQIYEMRPPAAQPQASPPPQRAAAPAPAPAGPVPSRQPFPVARAAPPPGGSGMYTATDGCFALVLFALIAAFAFLGGAWARHSQDHNGQSLSTWIKSVMAERQTAAADAAEAAKGVK